MSVTEAEATNVFTLGVEPDEIARKVADHLGRFLTREQTSSELVYSPVGEHSYYRDFWSVQTGRDAAGARERLDRHAEQSARIAARRQERAWERLTSSGLEYRVTPDRTQGTGGYFTPPAWLNELFATANRPGRVLSGLMRRFPLPPGVSSVNVPLIKTGTAAGDASDDVPVLDQDFTDATTGSAVVPLAGQADVPLQLLEQSPAGAHLDFAIFMDLSEATDDQLETQLLTGTGGTSNPATAQLPGILNLSGIATVTYTDAAPKGTAMWPYMSQVPAQVANSRKRPPECWLMRTARWAWLQAAEDSGSRPFGLSTRFFLGSDDNTPDPISGLMGWPVFLNEAIPATFGAGANQDVIVCLLPTDMILLEGETQTGIFREPGSGSLGVRLQSHCNVAALTGRRTAGIGVLQGTGLAVQSGF